MRTYWACDACGESTFIEHDKNIAVWDMLLKMKQSHDARAPEWCEFNRWDVRVTFAVCDER